MTTDKLNNGVNIPDFESIYMLYFNELYRFAYHYLMSEYAEDIVQEVFVKVFHDKELLSSAVNIRAYLYRITKNRCIDHLKHLAVESKHQDSLLSAILMNDDCEDEEQQMINIKIANCLSSLPEKQRAIIQLRLAGKDYNEIAEILQISVGTVNTHINRAYTKIKKNYYFLYFILNI